MSLCCKMDSFSWSLLEMTPSLISFIHSFLKWYIVIIIYQFDECEKDPAIKKWMNLQQTINSLLKELIKLLTSDFEKDSSRTIECIRFPISSNWLGSTRFRSSDELALAIASNCHTFFCASYKSHINHIITSIMTLGKLHNCATLIPNDLSEGPSLTPYIIAM